MLQMHAFGSGVRTGTVAQPKKTHTDMKSRLVLGEFGQGQMSFPPFVPSILQLALGVIFLPSFFLFFFLSRAFYSRFPLNIVFEIDCLFKKKNSKGFNAEDLR